MFARALIVLLLVLNVGVAAWWFTRPEPPPPMARAQPTGVARLQLVSDAVAGSTAGSTSAGTLPVVAPAAAASGIATAMPEPDAARAPAPESTSAATQCFALGPFANEPLALDAQARLQPQVERIVVRRQARAGGRGWRVYLPPLASIDEAQATIARIAAAGLDDYLLVRNGDEANSIALGRYGSEQAAQRRAAAVQAAGFAAVVAPLGEPPALWLDVEAAAGFDTASAQRDSGAARRRSVDCATLR